MSTWIAGLEADRKDVERELTGADTKEAIRLLGVYTAYRFDIWALAGRAKASCRAHVMSVLCGQKMTQAKSGVNAMRSAFYSQLGITGECEANREDNFRQYCRHSVAV